MSENWFRLTLNDWLTEFIKLHFLPETQLKQYSRNVGCTLDELLCQDANTMRREQEQNKSLTSIGGSNSVNYEVYHD